MKEKCQQVSLVNEDVYMATTFEEFVSKCVISSRGEGAVEFAYEGVEMRVNNMDLEFPNQICIGDQFVDAISGKKQKTINPSDESAVCDVSHGGVDNIAVAAAKKALEKGKWADMNDRDRGALLNCLAALMEAHQKELATIEDKLALKTIFGLVITRQRILLWCRE